MRVRVASGRGRTSSMKRSTGYAYRDLQAVLQVLIIRVDVPVCSGRGGNCLGGPNLKSRTPGGSNGRNTWT